MEVWVGTKKFVFGRGYYICSYSFSKSTKDVFNLQDDFIFIFLFLVFNATISNISAISWRPVLVVEEAGVPGENHRPWASN